MDIQFIINVALAILGAVGSLWLKYNNDCQRGMKSDIRQLFDKLSKTDVDIAGNYVRKPDMNLWIQEINGKLTKIEDLEMKLASDYPTKFELNRLMDRITQQLDRIENKVNGA